MTSPSGSHAGVRRVVRILIAASIFMGFYPASAIPAPQGKAGPPSKEKLSAEEVRLRTDWRIAMAQVPLPKKGCFQAAYPSKEWGEVLCTSTPNYPMPPRLGPRPLIVGNGDDIMAEAPSGFISTAIGSFDSLTNVTSESGPVCSGASVANAYTLQLNTEFFTSTACSGAAVPADCQGWEQFVYENYGTAGRAYIQYWLLSYNTACPAGWNTYAVGADTYCWRNNSGGAVAVPNQPITDLGQLSLSGTASATADSVTLSDGGIAYARAGDNAVNAAAGWRLAEFNVFGDGCGAQADFNAGAELVVRTRIFYGGTAPPFCSAQGFTGETNNLSFGPIPPPAASQPGPAVIFRESTAGGAGSNCAAATTVGDTHLATFDGLFYDFQASGDFVLAQVEPDFVVQARQVSGAPTWPNASVNSAVATRMGKTVVAVCLGRSQLSVNGERTELADGMSLSTPDGVVIWRRGNVYFITSPSGNSVRATVNASWIDVAVGLGRCPAKVTGLLTNANGDVNKIATRDGAVLTSPFAFDDLYHHYADSWRVQLGESLLSGCGDKKVERGIPRKTFYSRDLDPKVAERTRAVCVAAGVKGDALLDACTLDVAVIGAAAAAKVFVAAPQPVAVGTIVGATSGHGGWGLLRWWPLLILIVLILLALLILRRRGGS